MSWPTHSAQCAARAGMRAGTSLSIAAKKQRQVPRTLPKGVSSIYSWLDRPPREDSSGQFFLSRL